MGFDRFRDVLCATMLLAAAILTLAPPSQATAQVLGAEAASVDFHVVVAGDTLTWIATKHDTSWQAIAALNGLTNPNRIAIGQMLKLPFSRTEAVQAEVAPTPVVRPLIEEGAVRLSVPYRTQFDGSPYEESDCGPATLGMLLGAHGKQVATADLRRWIMESMGLWGTDYGSDWRSLVRAAAKSGFVAEGLYDAPGRYHKWTLDELIAQVRNDNPVMLLVRYRALPGHTGSSWWGDHYILVVGMAADGQLLYHDSAFEGQTTGAYRTISRDALLRAWSTVSVGIQYSAMTLTR